MKASTQTATGFRWEMTGQAGALRRADFELPEPGPGEALVRVVGCGVCHTDLGYLYGGVAPRAPLPLALGHEISGEVLAAGEDFQGLVGRAVIVPAVTPCGSCARCEAGYGAICERQVMPGNDLPGGFASHVLVPARGLCPVDVDGALEGASLRESGCGLAELAVVADAVTTPYQALTRARVGAGDFVVVVGLGGVGGFCAQIARALGATVVGFDIDPRRVAELERHGLAKGLDPRGADPRALRKDLRAFARERGHGEDRWKLFECSGTAPGQTLAWSLLGPGAHLSVVGYTMDKVELRLSNLMAFDAVAAGNWGCLPELYPDALELVLAGRVALAPFVETHPMAEIERVLERAHRHELTRRAVLVP